MENASKALIIAGAILLAILLISLGIMIFTQAQDTVENSGMSDAEIQSFNSKFLKYEGSVSGSEAKALVNEVIVNNGNEAGNTITITLDGNDMTAAPTTSGIVTSGTYNVALEYTGVGGRIAKINITK